MSRALTDDRGRPVREDGSLVRPEAADMLADTIVERLRPILEPAQIPDHAVTWFAEIAKFGVVHHQLVVPGYGSQYGPIVQMAFRPDGTAELMLADMNMSPFWRITLRGPA